MKKRIAFAGLGSAIAIGSLLGAGTAQAGDGYDQIPIHSVHVEAYWTGTNCLQSWTPARGNHNSVASVSQCNSSHGLVWNYSAAPGEWVGVDPEMGSNSSVSCTLYVDGYVMASDSALAGDGHEASCLVRL